MTGEPGLSFGLPFQYAASSDVLPGVGRDARFVERAQSNGRTTEATGPA